MPGQCSPVRRRRIKGTKAMDAVYENLFTPYGIMLNGPSYTVPDAYIGFVTRVYPGVKENGSVFSSPQPMGMGSRMYAGKGKPGHGIL